jgi:hypothetical protein
MASRMDEVSVNALESIAYACRTESMGVCIIRAELNTAGLLIRADGPLRGPTEPGVLLKGTHLIPWSEFRSARYPVDIAVAAMIRLREEVFALMDRPR